MIYSACNNDKEGDGEMNNIEANANNISYLLHRCPVVDNAMALDTASELNGMIMANYNGRLVMVNATCTSSKALELTGEMLNEIQAPADDKLFESNISDLNDMDCENNALKSVIARTASAEMQEDMTSDLVMSSIE